MQAMPSLKAFHPTWWALGPFAQTVVHGSRAVNNATPYHREGVLMHDGVAVALDWKVTDPRLSPEAPLVVVCHGLGENKRDTFERTSDDNRYSSLAWDAYNISTSTAWLLRFIIAFKSHTQPSTPPGFSSGGMLACVRLPEA